MRRTIPLAAATLWLAAAASLSGAPTPGDPAPQSPAPASLAELEARLARAFREAGIPGASYAVVENGRVVLANGYGFADVAARQRATADTVFRAGSISKSLTGVAVMTLVERGRLSLDARLADLAPEVRFRNPWEATDPVRLVHLLEHSTGWPDISLRVLLADGKGWPLRRGVELASPDYVSRWRPGLYSVYNNAGPAVAGLVLEKVSGQTFESYVREQVLRPMGMATGDFDLPPELAARLAKSYDARGGETPYQFITLGPSGSLAVSARELAQLVRFYLGRGTVDGRQILAPASVERIERGESTLAGRSGLTNGYGLGNAPLFDEGVTFRGHNGGIDSFTSVYGYSTRNGSGYVLLANGGQGVNFATPLTRMIQAYLTRGVSTSPPAKTTDAADTANAAPAGGGDLAAFAGLYRTITPANTLARPYQEILGLSRVSAGKGVLIVGGKEFVPAGAHSFRRVDRDEPSLAFVLKDGEALKLSAFASARKEPAWRVALGAVVLALLAFGILVSVAMLPVWVYGWARRRLAERGGAGVRFLPLAAWLALAATFALPLPAILSGSMVEAGRLAEPGPLSIAILACSLLSPLLAGLGLWRSWSATGAGAFVRLHAALTSLAVLGVAAYAASVGWIGVATWTL